MLKSIIFLSTIVTIAYTLRDADYCKLDTCNANSHTLCQFRWNGPAASCNAISSGLSDVDKQKILNLHNNLRLRVAYGKESRGMPGPQPRATNMQKLTWDDELAEIAQRWANQCNWNHDQCRDTKRFKVGQNIAYKATTGDVNTINIEDIVIGWYNEVEFFDANRVSHFSSLYAANGKQIGHYTQFVWADTNKLGCGAVKYPDGRGFNKFFLVCNYGPAGNWKGKAVYKTQ